MCWQLYSRVAIQGYTPRGDSVLAAAGFQGCMKRELLLVSMAMHGLDTCWT